MMAVSVAGKNVDSRLNKNGRRRLFRIPSRSDHLDPAATPAASPDPFAPVAATGTYAFDADARRHRSRTVRHHQSLL